MMRCQYESAGNRCERDAVPGRTRCKKHGPKRRRAWVLSVRHFNVGNPGSGKRAR